MFESLVEQFKLDSTITTERPEKNIFDICGFPHYEVVVSNILAFFFDSNEKHHLNELFVKSLIDSGVPGEINDFQFNVEREVRTDKGGFIDILLYNETHCLVIENKIFASLYNDLDDYLKYAEDYKGVKPIGIVLSLYNININHPRFINITYSIFVKNLKKNLGFYLSNGHNKFIFLLLELISNLEYLYSAEVSMDNNFVEFLKNNKEAVVSLAKKLKNFHDDLRTLVKQVNTIVKTQTNTTDIKQWAYRELPELFDVAVSDFKLSNGVDLAIASIVDINGWEFQIFVRRDNGIQFNLAAYCTEKGLTGNMQENRFILEKHYGLDTQPEEIAKEIVEIIKKIKA